MNKFRAITLMLMVKLFIAVECVFQLSLYVVHSGLVGKTINRLYLQFMFTVYKQILGGCFVNQGAYVCLGCFYQSQKEN